MLTHNSISDLKKIAHQKVPSSLRYERLTRFLIRQYVYVYPAILANLIFIQYLFLNIIEIPTI